MLMVFGQSAGAAQMVPGKETAVINQNNPRMPIIFNFDFFMLIPS